MIFSNRLPSHAQLATHGKRLDDVTRSELGFPHDFPRRMMPRGVENHRA